jgi:hypothetical protein
VCVCGIAKLDTGFGKMGLYGKSSSFFLRK